MLITALDQELVSGTKGVVVDFQVLSTQSTDRSQSFGADEDSGYDGRTLPLVQFDIPGRHRKRYALMTPVVYYADVARAIRVSRLQACVHMARLLYSIDGIRSFL